MRPTATAGVLAATLLVADSALAGCSSAPHVPPPRTTPHEQRLCARLHARLPEVLDGRRWRAVRPRSRLTAAWGDPAIVLTCGVPRPTGLRARSDIAVIDGVSWFARRGAHAAVFTVVGRRVHVRVVVPNHYHLPGERLTGLVPAIKSAIPENRGGVI